MGPGFQGASSLVAQGPQPGFGSLGERFGTGLVPGFSLEGLSRPRIGWPPVWGSPGLGGQNGWALGLGEGLGVPGGLHFQNPFPGIFGRSGGFSPRVGLLKHNAGVFSDTPIFFFPQRGEKKGAPFKNLRRVCFPNRRPKKGRFPPLSGGRSAGKKTIANTGGGYDKAGGETPPL